MYDIRSRSEIESILEPQQLGVSGTSVCDTVDIKGFEALDHCIVAEVTSGSFSVALYEGDESDMSDESLVDDEFIIGEEGELVTGTGAQTVHIGYVGHKRYTRSKVTRIGASVDINFAGIAYKGHAKSSPTTN